MNASARALAAGTFNPSNLRHMLFSWQNNVVMFLLIASLSTAFAVIYVKDMNRREFIELHQLQRQHDDMVVEQGQLLLEQNTWSSPLRVQRIAQQQFGMVNPAKSIIVFTG